MNHIPTKGRDVAQHKNFSPWAWIPTLYFAEGMPNIIVVSMSVLMYKNLGISNGQTAFFTSLIYLAWVVKPLWSPIVDIVGTKRRWIITMQLAMAAILAIVGLSLLTPFFFVATLIALGLLAFLSATHDIAADGFYMLGLSEHRQSYFVGVRSVFYKLSTVAVSAGAPWLSAMLMNLGFGVGLSWAIVFGVIALMFVGLGFYHNAVLPRPVSDHGKPDRSIGQVAVEFCESFSTFFAKPGIVVALLFMMLYRLPESMLVKMITPFLVDPVNVGGLGLQNSDVAVIYGIVGVIGLLAGGLLGGWLISRGGLRKWIMPMALGMSLSCLTFVVLSHVAAPSRWLIDVMVFIEQFGYGFGFSAYMLYLIYFARGQFATSHYAIATGFMALGLMLPGMAAGWLQELMGYQNFFWLTIVSCFFTVAVTILVHGGIDPSFGKKSKS